MKKLGERTHKKLEKGLEAKCPHFMCRGTLFKSNAEDFKQHTEECWEKTNYYRCTNNPKHVWKYLTEPCYIKKTKP